MIDDDIDEMFNRLPDELELESCDDINLLHAKNKELVPEHVREMHEKSKIEKAKVKFNALNEFLIKSFEEIGELPKANEVNIVTTKRSFNAIAIILFILQKHKSIKEIYISGSSLNIKSAYVLEDLCENKNIGKITYVLTSMILKVQSNTVLTIKKIAEKYPKFKLIFAWNHSKVISCNINDKKFITITGTGNLSNNARIEQYCIFGSKKVFDHNKNWIDNIKEISASKDVTIYSK